jgi:hypothetical protein
MGRLLKSISIRRPANLHTKICLKKKDKKFKICYLFWKKSFSSFDDNVKSSVITEKDNTTKFEILLTFDPSPEFFYFDLFCFSIYMILDVPDKFAFYTNICIWDISRNSFKMKEDYDHLKLACKPIFQKINTLYGKASIEVEGKHFDLDILMGGDMKFLQLVLGLGGSLSTFFVIIPVHGVLSLCRSPFILL